MLKRGLTVYDIMNNDVMSDGEVVALDVPLAVLVSLLFLSRQISMS